MKWQTVALNRQDSQLLPTFINIITRPTVNNVLTKNMEELLINCDTLNPTKSKWPFTNTFIKFIQLISSASGTRLLVTAQEWKITVIILNVKIKRISTTYTARKCATYNDYYRNSATGLCLINQSIPTYSYYEQNVRKRVREDCWI